MKPALLFLLGTGSAVLAGPCKPSPPSSHLTETVPQDEATKTRSAGDSDNTATGLPSTTGYDNPEVTQSQSDTSGESSGIDVPGSGSTSNWLPGWSSDSTWPGQNTPTPGVSGSFTSGQPEETHDTHIIVETSTGTGGLGDGTATQTGSDGQETNTSVVGTETDIAGTETGVQTPTGSNGDGAETGSASVPFNTETDIQTQTGPDGEATVTGSVPVDATQTGSSTETGTNGQETETGSGATETETNGQGTATGSAPIGTETGINTQTGSNGEGTETDIVGTETGANTQTGSDGQGTATGSVPIDATQTGSNTETGTNGQATETGNDQDTQTSSAPIGTTGVITATGTDAETAPVNTETGSAATETGSDGENTETNSAPTDVNTETDGGATNTGSETDTGSPTNGSGETSVNQPGQTTSDSEGPTVTDSTPPKTTVPGADITSAPVPATTKSGGDDGITSTLTEPPADFSPTTVSNDDWSTNTWITTTSEGSDEPTVVPVLVGCPGCGGSGHGIVIFGFPPIPNTLFNFPKFPSLPKFSFPCIPGLTPGCSTSNAPETHEDNNDDDDDDDDDQSTAEDKSTAEPTTSEAETTTSAEECSATEIGGSCTNCPKNIYVANDNDDVELIDDGDDILKRAVAPAPAPVLGKRSPAEPIISIGGGICTLQKTGVQFPEYPSGPELFKADKGAAAKPGDTYYNTFKWFIGVQDANTCARSLQAVGKKDFGKTITPKKTMDHVYEKSMLRDFFTHILDNGVPTVKGVKTGTQGKINCGDLAYYTNDDPNVPGPNLLEEVYGAFPGYNQYLDDFIGMDDYTNSICKGTIATPGNLPNEVSNIASVGKVVRANTPWKNVEKWMEALLQTLEKLSIGVELWNHQEVQTVVIRQNRRIHSRFVNIDNNAKNCKQDDAVKNNVWSFSTAYQNYMNNLFDGSESYSINPIVKKAADDLIARMDINLVALQARLATLNNDEKALVTKWQTRYAPLKTATYQVSFTWDFSYTSLKRRQEEGESCAVPTTSLSETATSSAISSFTTSYISRTSQDVVTTTEEPTRTTTIATPTESEWDGVCPTQWEILVIDGKIPDGAGEKCLCKDMTPAIKDESPYQPEQLDAAIGDFCDGSRTLHYSPTGIPEKINRDYKLGNKSFLSIGVQFTTLGHDRCKSPVSEVVLADHCKTALQRLKCQNKKDNYGGFYNEVTDDGCFLWSTGIEWSSSGEWPGAVDLPSTQ
ncbi:hypothetical protein IL306_008644 [Fusarium sp. DS 682]|nr:hypothetical protein IL306_008644 [Fusarium sp. DS 682]